MARGMDPESRPISVAELLARAKEQGADDVVSAVGNSPAATGRRRRGGKDSVSVAELTGEIPRVTAQPKTAETSQPEAAEASQPKAEDKSRPKAAEETDSKADSPSTLPPTRDFSAAEVSKRAAAAQAGVKPTPGAPDRPAPLGAQSSNAQSGAAQKSDSGDASADAVSKPGASEQDSAGTRSSAGGPDEETTGVIPSMQAYSQVDDNGDDDHHVLSAAEREREFERYRNFEDVETGAATATASSGGKKKKRGLFGFGRKAETETRPEADHDVDAHADRTVTQFIPKVADETGSASGASTPEPEPERQSEPASESVPVSRAQAAKSADRYLRFDADPDATAAAPVITAAAADDEEDDDAKPAEVADESPTSEIGRVRGADTSPAATTGPAAADKPAADKSSKPSLIKDVPKPADSGRDPAPTPSGSAEEQSPTVQWAVLIGQVLAGLAVGVALFWGFTELWRWNVLFALILSVAVIFGLVTLVHVVRRSNDLISTLLAMGVGLLVTIGPLVLLLIAGD